MSMPPIGRPFCKGPDVQVISLAVTQSVKGASDDPRRTLALSTESREGRLTIYIHISIIIE